MTLFCYVPSRLFYSTLLRVFPSSKQLINKLPEPRVAWLLSLASLYQHQHQHQHPSPPHRAIWPLTYIQYETLSPLPVADSAFAARLSEYFRIQIYTTQQIRGVDVAKIDH